jgi:nucleoside-triphosphatase THEP1
MILVLTGPVHSGKTSLLKNLVNDLKGRGVRVDGFLSLAVVQGGEILGYDLFDLRSGTAIPFIRKKGQRKWQRIGAYFFIPEALEKAQQKVLQRGEENFLIIDEVGPLEIQGGGIWPALSAGLKKPSSCCLLVVRDSILRDALKVIGSKNIEIVDIKKDKSGSVLLEKITAAATSQGRTGETDSGIA